MPHIFSTASCKGLSFGSLKVVKLTRRLEQGYRYQSPRLLDFYLSLEEEIKFLSKVYTEVERSLFRTKRVLAEAHRGPEQLHNANQPIGRLPTEILRLIFSDNISVRDKPNTMFLLRITSVCHAWRDIAICDLTLWTCIFFIIGAGHHTPHHGLLETYFMRSANAKFYLCMSYHFGPPDIRAFEWIIPLVHRYIHRCYHLQFYSEHLEQSDASMALFTLPGRLPALRDLDVNVANQNAIPLFLADVDGDIRSLKVKCNNIVGLKGFPTNCLVDLHIDGCLDCNITSFLALHPSLVSLRLTNQYNTFDTQVRYEFPELRNLDVRRPEIMHFIHAPNLRHLSIQHVF